MKNVLFATAVAFCLAMPGARSLAQTKAERATARLDSVGGLELVNGKAEMVTYRGRRAVHLQFSGNVKEDDTMLAILAATDFKDGVIQIDVAGSPKGDNPNNRGFIGIAFRLQGRDERGEYFYIRPTNGRADDQLRRNHSLQYMALPDYPWHRLRKENPGIYESYADLQPGVWTTMKVVVAGHKAQLYINGAAQPALIVNDLKLGDVHGPIALWAYYDTDAYFSDLKVTDSGGTE